MPAKLIDGKATALEIRDEVMETVAGLRERSGKQPALAVLLVGSDPASDVYVRSKNRACEKAGIHSITVNLPSDISENALLAEIDKYNADDSWHGILVQLPLPAHIDSQKVIEAIDPLKDVDCFHPFNTGRLCIGMPIFEPATPAGIIELLHRYQIDPAGKHVVILGRSNIVGKPLANLFVQKHSKANAIVTVVHSAAKDIAVYTRTADILVAAIGRPEYVSAEMIKPGAVVIDVGINRIDDAHSARGYRLVGDVAFAEATKVASYITPVPGGVGPMTIAMLLANTVRAFKLQTKIS